SICDILDNDKGLSPDKAAFREVRCKSLCEDLATLSDNFDEADPGCLAAIEALCTVAVKKGTKGTGVTPEHPFFVLCQRFCDSVAAYFERLNHEFIEFAKHELPMRKARLNALTYD